jgi:Tfp pilus assembly protein PilO
VKVKLALIGVGASLLLTVAWYFALWKPASNNLSETQAREATAQTQVDSLTTELARLKQLEANQEVLERDLAALAVKLPDKDQLDTFILELNDIATTAGITLQSLSPGEPTLTTADPSTGGAAAVGPIPITLQMQVQGDYFAILRFMDALRDGTRLVTANNLSLSGGADAGQMSASIGGAMYIARPVVPAAATTPTTAPEAAS